MTVGCGGYSCECSAVEDAVMVGLYLTCSCGHTAVIHSGDVNDIPASAKVDYTPIVETKKEMAKKPSAKPKPKLKLRRPKTVSKSETGLTVSEARTKLRAAGYEVGQRGRITSELMNIAAGL